MIQDMPHTTIRFTKMHGAGNDYIYVDATRYPLACPERAARLWSDRHRGIGSDGLVLIGRATVPGADFSMRIFNADGSEAMMCGNASRCIGKYLYERGLTDQTEIRLETLSGVRRLLLAVSGDRVERVTVDMLAPRLHLAAQYDERVDLAEMAEAGHPVFVSMGNPHCVIFVDDIDHTDIAALGTRYERSAAFPERCNIEFAQLTAPATLRTRVWERGSGITLACGTGASATLVAAHTLGITGREADIVMDGGTLHIRWDEADGHVYLSGPAETVYEGEILSVEC